MSTNQSDAPASKMRKSRKIVIGLLVGLLAGVAGFALAAYLFKAPMTGSVKSGNFSAIWTGTPTLGTGNASNFCGAVAVQGADLKITAGSGAFPGDKCVINAPLKMAAGASEDGVIAGFTTALPAGYRATLTQGCGSTLVKTGTPTTVVLTIEMLPTATPDGSTYNFTAADGVTVQPASAGAPTCS